MSESASHHDRNTQRAREHDTAMGLDAGAGLEADLGLPRHGRVEARPRVGAGWRSSRHSRSRREARGSSTVTRRSGQAARRRSTWASWAAVELGGLGPRAVSRWCRCGGIALGGPPVEPELAGERGDRPAVAVKHVQFHPGVLRLHPVPPVAGFELEHPEPDRGDAPSRGEICEGPRVSPRASALFVINSLAYSCSLTDGHARQPRRVPVAHARCRPW